ncbi:MAG: DUF2934 domain-containing protein [Bauldia litoralis]
MGTENEHLIRERAYELWEADGRPDGKKDDHWAQAARELEEASTSKPSLASDPIVSSDLAVGTKAPRARTGAPSKRAAKGPKP